MLYDLKKIELEQINRAFKNRLYRIERDRLKPRYFIYLNYPLCNYFGLNVNEAKGYVYADFIARYKRLTGKNVLFSLGYNNVTSSILNIETTLDRPLSSFAASGFLTYQHEMKMLEISYDEEKEIVFNSEEYIMFIQKAFQFFHDKKLITLKNGLVVFDENKVYQKGEYYLEGDNCFSLDGKKLNSKIKNYYALSIKPIQKELFNLIECLNLSTMQKNILTERIMYYKALKFKCLTTSDSYLEISLEKPEYVCGLSFVVLNPNYVDVKPFINSSEYEEIQDLIYESKDELLFSGSSFLSPIVSNNVPIFISTKFDEAIHLGIPSVNEIDEFLCCEYDLEYNPIFDYINGEKVLVNSGKFNGMNLSEASVAIFEFLISNYDADSYSSFALDELNITSMKKFGIPIPLRQDQSDANLPVIYNLKHDVKLENGELADKFLVKEFLADDFVNSLVINAIRLKGETGVLDFESKMALDEIGLFNKVDVMLLNQTEYVNVLLWFLIINLLWKKYYVSSFEYPIKKTIIVKPVLDKKLRYISKDNNNLISINDLLEKYGSTILRLSYAIGGIDDENNIFDINEVDDLKELVEKIVKTFYFPIDDKYDELNQEYINMLTLCKSSAKVFDFRTYLEAIISFVNKVHSVKRISKKQAKGLLVVLSVLIPALAEQIKEDVLNAKEPLMYYCWPE